MNPWYPDDRRAGLPIVRADGRAIGPAIRVLLIIILAPLAWLMAASGFTVNEAATFAQRHCTGRGSLLCEFGNLLTRLIPPSWGGTVELLLRLGFFVLLLGLIAGLLKPLLSRRRH